LLFPNQPSPKPLILGLILLLALGHSIIALHGMRNKSVTGDELAHITGGYTFNYLNDYRMHPENGILTQRWQAIPLIWADATYPNLDTQYWRESNVWMTGQTLFFNKSHPHEAWLFQARAMNTLLGAGVVLLVAWWSWHLFGPIGSLIAACFCALDPTMLAHSALATSDMAMTLGFLSSMTLFDFYLRNPNWPNTLFSAFVFGLACLAKYSSVLLPLLFIILTLCRYTFKKHPNSNISSSQPPVKQCAKSKVSIYLAILTHALCAWVIIWAACGFRYSAFNPALPPGDFSLPWDFILNFGGWKASLINFLRQWHILPEAFLYGFSFVLQHAQGRGAFLDGEYSIQGWVEFFPKTFLYKTAGSLLLALIAGLTILLIYCNKSRKEKLLNVVNKAAPIIILFIVYWGISLPSRLNIGHRHILPTYPVLYIFCGILGWAIIRNRVNARINRFFWGTITTVLICAQITLCLFSHPHHLAFFNSIAGGSENGYKHLVDSSLDWGQDLRPLKSWLNKNQRINELVHLSYFGAAVPEYYGIDAIQMPTIYNFGRNYPWYWPGPGLYAISATMLQHVYMPIRGPWTGEREQLYQAFRAYNPVFKSLKANPNQPLPDDTSGKDWALRWDQFEQYRFARLCHYLRSRQPDANVGYSILIYRLTQNEIEDALEGPWSQLVTAIERNQRLTP
jgi:hypothetical protein